jgi:hypothetical protein
VPHPSLAFALSPSIFFFALLEMSALRVQRVWRWPYFAFFLFSVVFFSFALGNWKRKIGWCAVIALCAWRRSRTKGQPRHEMFQWKRFQFFEQELVKEGGSSDNPHQIIQVSLFIFHIFLINEMSGGCSSASVTAARSP